MNSRSTDSGEWFTKFQALGSRIKEILDVGARYLGVLIDGEQPGSMLLARDCESLVQSTGNPGVSLMTKNSDIW